MVIEEINRRYSGLAETTCCLSCGGAINYAGASKGEICVDLGSGRGTDAMRLAEAVGSEGFVYGIDISEGMLKKARGSAERLGVKNVKFLNCTLEKIELDGQVADVVISNCTINHSSDKQSVWNEVFRILKDNGRFIEIAVFPLQLGRTELKGVTVMGQPLYEEQVF